MVQSLKSFITVDPNHFSEIFKSRMTLSYGSLANGRQFLMQWERYMNLNPKIKRQTISLFCLNHGEICCVKRDTLIDSTPTCAAFRE